MSRELRGPIGAADRQASDPLPMEEESVTRSLEPAAPLKIAVWAPRSDNLRAAFSVVIADPETDQTVVADPVFLTSIRGEIIATDLPLELLRDESQEILTLLDDARGSASKLSARLDSSMRETWERVVAATEELGTANVGEAVNFVASLQPVAAGV